MPCFVGKLYNCLVTFNFVIVCIINLFFSVCAKKIVCILSKVLILTYDDRKFFPYVCDCISHIRIQFQHKHSLNNFNKSYFDYKLISSTLVIYKRICTHKLCNIILKQNSKNNISTIIIRVVKSAKSCQKIAL